MIVDLDIDAVIVVLGGWSGMRPKPEFASVIRFNKGDIHTNFNPDF